MIRKKLVFISCFFSVIFSTFLVGLTMEYKKIAGPIHLLPSYWKDGLVTGEICVSLKKNNIWVNKYIADADYGIIEAYKIDNEGMITYQGCIENVGQCLSLKTTPGENFILSQINIPYPTSNNKKPNFVSWDATSGEFGKTLQILSKVTEWFCPQMPQLGNMTKSLHDFTYTNCYLPQKHATLHTIKHYKFYKLVSPWEYAKIRKGLELKKLNTYKLNLPNTIEIVPNTSLLLAECGDGKIQIWNLKKETRLEEFDSSQGTIDKIITANDGTFFVTISYESKSLKLWSTETMTCVQTLKLKRVKKEPITQICISPDNNSIIAALDTKILCWDWKNNTVKTFNAEHEGNISALTISPNNNLVVSGDKEGVVKLWGIENGKLLHSWNNPIEEESVKVSCIKFSEDNKTIYGTFTPYPKPSEDYYFFKIF